MRYKPKQIGEYQIKAGNPQYESQLSNKVYVLSLKSEIFTIKDLFQDPYVLGLFKYISTGTDEWSTFIKTHIEIPASDVEYVFNYSGEKYVSPLIINIIKSTYGQKTDGYPLNTKWLKIISDILKQRYYIKWKKLYDSLNITYDPLSPYLMLVEDDDTEQIEGTNKKQGTITNDTVSSSESKRQGFNSTSYQPFSQDTGTDESNEEQNITTTDNNERTRLRKIKRQGNIGNITMQELIEKERDIYQFQFMNSVYKDIDTVLTINYYGGIK